MEEKEGEYHAEMTAKLDWFRLQHAARVIQVAWKETLASRAEKAKVCDSYLHKKNYYIFHRVFVFISMFVAWRTGR